MERIGGRMEQQHGDGFVRQQMIRARCTHPSGEFVEFSSGELEQSISARFARQAATFRDRVAVKTRTQAVTYGELDHASDRLAGAIRVSRGHAAEPVALLLDKGPGLIVAILGALKAGKIYSPLSPAFPAARLEQILADARPGLVITDRAHLSLAERIARGACQVLDLDALPATPRMGEARPISPDDRATLFYTSGSTGQPKGVVDTHRSTLHFAQISTNQFHVCARDKMTFMASQGRDIFISLLNGACVYPIDLAQDGLVDVAPWLIAEEVTILYSAASVLRSLLGTLTEGMRMPAVRLIVSIGEPLYRHDVELVQRRFSPRCILVNALGNTETMQYRHYFMDMQTRLADGVVPAGWPVPDKETILVGEDGEAVETGQPGEITVRTRYMAQGYWRKPELTRAKFRPDPGGGPERIYHTGDLGLVSPDGSLVYLGRQDGQVKIRGHRVELAEVEMAMLDVDGVQEAVVVAHGGGPDGGHGDPRLVAYVVARGTSSFSVRALREALAATLPAYMIPSAFVRLDHVPRMGFGKVDRRALPAPSGQRPALDIPFAVPQTPAETALARIWAEVLGVAEVGLDDPFLEIGGTSLLAVQIITEAIRMFRVDISFRSLIGVATVRDMALLVTQRGAERLDDDAVERLLSGLESPPEREAGPSA